MESILDNMVSIPAGSLIRTDPTLGQTGRGGIRHRLRRSRFQREHPLSRQLRGEKTKSLSAGVN